MKFYKVKQMLENHLFFLILWFHSILLLKHFMLIITLSIMISYSLTNAYGVKANFKVENTIIDKIASLEGVNWFNLFLAPHHIAIYGMVSLTWKKLIFSIWGLRNVRTEY